jgi:hypothetical protein
MTSFLYMSIKYHGLEYFVSKHMLWIDVKNTMIYHGYIMTFKYYSIQTLWYLNTLLPNRP